jgi:hypothetical protein
MFRGRRCIVAIVTLLAALLPATARAELVDDSASFGSTFSLALAVQRQPRIAYYDATNDNLKYASRSAAGIWTIEVVDTTGNVGSYCSLALSSANVPRIAYYDATNGNLKYASKSGSTWVREVVATLNDVGRYCSLVLDSGNNPHISYYDASNQDLKYVYKDGAFWLIDTVDNTGGIYTSIALDSQGDACIAYLAAGDVKYAVGRADWTIQIAADGTSIESPIKDVSLALDSQDDPHIAFTSLYIFGEESHYNARYATRPASTWSNLVIQSGSSTNDCSSTSVEVDSDGEPHIVYRNDGQVGQQFLHDLRHAWRAGGFWNVATFLPLGGFNSGLGTSLGINPQDELSVAYIAQNDLYHVADTRTIDVTSPPSGQQYGVSEVVDIAWTTTLSPTADVTIQFGTPGGTRQTIATADAGASPVPWEIPEDFGSAFRVWVSDAFDGSPIDSSLSFSICPALSTVRQFIDYSVPNDIISADFNDDRIPDMIVCLSGLGGVGFDVALGTGAFGVGDGDFGAPTHYPVSGGSSVRDAAAGDFNGDGRLDLAVSISAGVQMFLGNGTGDDGDGTFTAGAVAAGGSTTRGIVAADFDEDGLLDVALVNGGSNTISVFRGLGNGTLQAGVTYAVGSSPSRAFVGDFNEDGIWDLAVTNNVSDTISILRGQGSGGKGNGAFLAASSFSAGDAPLGLAGGDFNDDGVIDLAVAANNSAVGVSVLLGNGAGGIGNGTFAAPVSHPFGSTARDVGVADMNGDGIADLLASAGSGDGVAVFFGSGSGGLGDGAFVYGKTVPGDDFPNQMVVGDFAEDGRPDCLATFNNTNSVLLYESVCSPQFSTTVTTTAPNGGEYWLVGSSQTITWSRGTGVMAVDVEVSRDSGSNWQKIATNLTGTSFTWTVTPPATADARIRVVDSAVSSRFDESNLDFAIASGPYLVVGPNGGETLRSLGSSNITWLTNTTGTVKLEYRIGNGPKQTIAVSTANDGTAPWYVPNVASTQVRVFVSNGSAVDSSDAYFSICQRLAAGVLYSSGGAGQGLALGDFNEDGIADLVQTGCSLHILTGQGSGGLGNGAFSPPALVSMQSCGGAVITGDFNDDGITDLAATDGAGISTFRGQGSGGAGNGSFVRSATYPLASIAEGLAIADFNEDGVEDLVTALRAQDQVAIFFGNGGGGLGTGTFGSPTLIAVGDGPMDVVVQDFNADGIWDIVTSNAHSANLSYLRGSGSSGVGNGTFAATVSYTGPGGSRLIAADFTGDSRVDLAGGNVTVVPGTGSGFATFSAPITTSGLYPVLAVTSFDGNSYPDLVGLGSGSLELMLNESGSFVHIGSLQSMGAAPELAIAGDFLEDGAVDLVANSDSEPSVAVSLGASCGVSSSVVSITESGATTWAVGTSRTFNWSKSPSVHRVDVDISRDNGVNWESIAREISGTSFIWTVTGPPSTQVRLRVRDTARATVFDVADAVVTISGGAVSDVPPARIDERLLSVRPNPASGAVTLEVSLTEPAPVDIVLYDVHGRRVRTLHQQLLPKGTHAIIWDGTDDDGRMLPSGIYWARARWGGYQAEQRIVRLR